MSSKGEFTEKCCEPGVISSGKGVGRDVVIDGVATYIIGNNPDKLIVFSTDVFGQTFPNSRTVADYYAEAGFTVVIPDQFNGEAYTLDEMSAKDGMQKLFNEWLPKHPQKPDKLIQVVKALQKDGKYKSVQVAGFCYGAPQAIQLLTLGVAKAGVVGHPTRLSINYAEGLNAPILFLCAENDFSFTPELRAEWEKTLKERGVAAHFSDHPGTDHGFCVRHDGSPEKEKQKMKAADEARQFFLKYA